MYKNWLCYFFGHKTMVKAFTGNKMEACSNGFIKQDMMLYKWQRERYCIRCGMEVWRDVKE